MVVTLSMGGILYGGNFVQGNLTGWHYVRAVIIPYLHLSDTIVDCMELSNNNSMVDCRIVSPRDAMHSAAAYAVMLCPSVSPARSCYCIATSKDNLKSFFRYLGRVQR